MKQLLSTYTFDATAKTVTLSNVNIPLNQVLLIAGKGKILYSLADNVGAAGYTQGSSSVITLQSVYDLVSLDPLTIYYDDGIETINPSSGIQGNSVNERYISVGINPNVGPQLTEDKNRTSFQIYSPLTTTTSTTIVRQNYAITSVVPGSAVGSKHVFSESQPITQDVRFNISANAGSTIAFITQTLNNDGIISSPKAYPNLRLWLDSADNSTLFNAVTGGSVVTNGGSVARWEDKSGNNRHATQATEAVMPTYTTITKTSPSRGVYFNSDFMQFTTGALPSALSTNKFTIFAIVNPTTSFSGNVQTLHNSTASILSKASPSSSNSGQWQLDGEAGTSTTLTNGGGFPSFKRWGATNLFRDTYAYGAATQYLGHSEPTSSDTDITLCVQFDGSNVNIKKGFDTLPTTTETFSATTTTSGDFLGRNMLTTNAVCYIKEIIIYDSILTSTQVNSVEQYLVDKWTYIDGTYVARKPDYRIL